MLTLWLFGCPGDLPSTSKRHTTPSGIDTADSAAPPRSGPVEVEVRLDGAPVQATVYVGGDIFPRTTDNSGRITLDDVPSGVIIASHPASRTEGVVLYGASAVTIDLETIASTDNSSYVFQDPGNPDDSANTSKCAHCHIAITAEWHNSPHARSASSVIVHDTYAGTVSALTDEASCSSAGGRWWTGIGPGTGMPAQRCYLGAGTLPDLDPSCGDTEPCDGIAIQTGGCADCHAPGIDGQLGGRDLLEATGLAYTYGVHCDVCHKVESVDVGAAPGVAGALAILRPLEPDPSPVFEWRPLTFGPYDDVPNPRMGSAYRALFHEPELCAGCHELRQEVLMPGLAADPARWPDGRLPIHTTYTEWLTGPLSPVSPCQSCHMPPDPSAGNAADLGTIIPVEDAGFAAGWLRPPGSVRRHSFPGPRQRALGLLDLAAAIDVETSVASGQLTVRATVTNTGAGHAIPTGEPLRALLLRVEASCDGAALVPTGGDVLPDWAGALDVRAGGDFTVWPGASIGDTIRVVARTGEFHDVPGFGLFGDGTFDATQKGMPVEIWVGESTVTAIDGDTVILDAPLPAGDIAYRVAARSIPTDGDPITAMAGAPGFAYARVLIDAQGSPMVPHHRAVDVRSDDRLMPLSSWTSTHTFAASCDDPVVHAALIYRPAPFALSTERRWALTDSVIAEVVR